MGLKPKVDKPNEGEIAKKQQKKRDFASVAEAMRQANRGIRLLRPPESKPEERR